MIARGGDEHLERARVRGDLEFFERRHPVIGVARARTIDLLDQHARELHELGMIRKVGRLEQPRTVAHGLAVIAGIGLVDPRADDAVRMIDAQAVVLGERFVGTRGDERARAAVHLIRIEHGIAPRLPRRIRATRRCAHAIAAQECRRACPRIGIRVADREVTVQREPELGRDRANAGVLAVGE